MWFRGLVLLPLVGKVMIWKMVGRGGMVACLGDLDEEMGRVVVLETRDWCLSSFFAHRLYQLILDEGDVKQYLLLLQSNTLPWLWLA